MTIRVWNWAQVWPEEVSTQIYRDVLSQSDRSTILSQMTAEPGAILGGYWRESVSLRNLGGDLYCITQEWEEQSEGDGVCFSLFTSTRRQSLLLAISEDGVEMIETEAAFRNAGLIRPPSKGEQIWKIAREADLETGFNGKVSTDDTVVHAWEREKQYGYYTVGNFPTYVISAVYGHRRLMLECTIEGHVKNIALYDGDQKKRRIGRMLPIYRDAELALIWLLGD